MSDDKIPLYQENEKVLVHHQNNIYEAKILKYELRVDPKNKSDPTKKHFYFIHYLGWKEKWNEWVEQSRILKFNDQNVELMTAMRGRTRSSSGPAINNGGGSSGGSGGNGGSGSSQPLSKKKPKNDDTTSTTSTTTSSQNKRKREVPSNIVIEIPDVLKRILVDDWNFITNDKSIVSLPRNPSIKSLLDDFVNNNKETTAETTLIIEGLIGYFNKALGCQLLYKFERPQYSDVLKNHPDKPLSELYGAEHLLRLFVKLPELIAISEMVPETVTILTKTIDEILKYLERNSSALFLKEYNPVTSYYNRLASN